MQSVSVHIAVLAIATDAAPTLVVNELVTAAGHRVISRATVMDALSAIRAQLARWIDDPNIDVIIVSGGVESKNATSAMKPLVTKSLPGFTDLFRYLAFQEIGASAMLSNAEAAQCHSTFVFVLPAAAGAVRAAMEKLILPQLDANTTPQNLVSQMPRLRNPGEAAVPVEISKERTEGGSGLTPKMPAITPLRDRPKTGANIIPRRQAPTNDPPTKPIDVARLEQQIALSEGQSTTKRVDLSRLPSLPPGADEELTADELLEPDTDQSLPALRPGSEPAATPSPARVVQHTPLLGAGIVKLPAAPAKRKSPTEPPPVPSRRTRTEAVAVVPPAVAVVPPARASRSSGPSLQVRPAPTGSAQRPPGPKEPPGAPPSEPAQSGTNARSTSASGPARRPTEPPPLGGGRRSTESPPLGSATGGVRRPTEPPPLGGVRRSTEPPPLGSAIGGVRRPTEPPPLGGVRRSTEPPPLGSATGGVQRPTEPPPLGSATGGVRRPTEPPPLGSATGGVRRPTEPPPLGGVRRSTESPPLGGVRRPTEPPPLTSVRRSPTAPPHALATETAPPAPTELPPTPSASEPTPAPEAAIEQLAEPAPVAAPPTAEPAVEPDVAAAPDPAALVRLSRARNNEKTDLEALVAAPLERASGDLPLGTFNYPVKKSRNKLVWGLALLATGALGFAAVVLLFPRDSAPSEGATREDLIATAPADAAIEPSKPEPEPVAAPEPAPTPAVAPEPTPTPAVAPEPTPTPAVAPEPVAAAKAPIVRVKTPPANPVPRVTAPDSSGTATKSQTAPRTPPAGKDPEPAKDPQEDSAPAGPDADEVACVLAKYNRPGCDKYRPAESDFKPRTTGVPEDLDKAAVRAGIEKIKPRVVACGEQNAEKGTVKIAVKVRPDGAVSEAEVVASPGEALGACVAAAMRKGQFSKSVNGASFTYPFVF